MGHLLEVVNQALRDPLTLVLHHQPLDSLPQAQQVAHTQVHHSWPQAAHTLLPLDNLIL